MANYDRTNLQDGEELYNDEFGERITRNDDLADDDITPDDSAEDELMADDDVASDNFGERLGQDSAPGDTTDQADKEVDADSPADDVDSTESAQADKDTWRA